MLVSNQIPALYNGVSQQPATLRSVTQCEDQINGWSTIVDGLQKRAPTEFIAYLTDAVPSGAFVHEINRDAQERYIVILLDGDIMVFDLQGNRQTVLMSAGYDYLQCPSGTTPKSNFSLVTVADYTFVVNKAVTVALDEVRADEISQTLDQWWLNRPNEGDSTGASKQGYQPNPSTAGLPAQPSIVQSFQKLPETGGNLMYQITGTDESSFTTYYVRKSGAVWNECVRPGLRNLIKASTMPHALVRIAPGVFEFGHFSWAPRRVGDEYSNPHPTFVGRQIRDVFFYKNRLGFLVDENAVMSRAGDFGVFHRMTVLDVLADDVIDIAASETKVTKMNHAIPFANSLMLFSDQVQFRMNHQGIVSPGSMSLDVATQYEMATKVRPVPMGSDIYFASENEAWATLREYYVRDDVTLTEAADLTAHVPRYLPAGVTRIIPANDHDALFVLTDGAPNRVYVYKFYWEDETKKAQSAWSYWQLRPTDKILSGVVLDGFLHLVIHRGPVVVLEKIALDSGAKAANLQFQVYLEHRARITGTYLPTDDWTEYEMPYDIETADRDDFRVVRASSTAAGQLINSTQLVWHPVDKRIFRVRGNYQGHWMMCGLKYDFRYTFSEQFMKTSQQVPVTTGRLQLRTFNVYYTNTAFFRTEVAPYGNDPEVETIIPSKMADFTGKTLGDDSLTLGAPVFHEGTYAFQIYGNSDVARVTLTNDSHLSCNFQSAEWEGFYQNRARFR